MKQDNESSENEYQAALIACLSSNDLTRSYFPMGHVDPSDRAEHFLLCHCALVLQAMDELCLAAPEGTSDIERYRLLWLRTFHRPMAVRAEREGARTLLAVKVLDGRGGCDPGKLALRDERPLSRSQWRELDEKVSAARFWSLPLRGKHVGLDGAEWVLEGVRGTDYRVVQRWSPNASGKDAKFRALCLHLIRLAALDSVAEPIY